MPREGLRGGRYRTYSLAERLAARTVRGAETDCWPFRGCVVGNNGYGQLMRDAPSRERIYAHRAAWEGAYGPIPDGLRVCHRCDNPRCVNPTHLFLGTQAENVRDCVNKGRHNAFGIRKLIAAEVLEIRALSATGMRQKDIGAQFGIARNTVSGIVHRLTWRHVDEPTAELGSAASPGRGTAAAPVRA
jgi:HNH endonuclease